VEDVVDSLGNQCGPRVCVAAYEMALCNVGRCDLFLCDGDAGMLEEDLNEGDDMGDEEIEADHQKDEKQQEKGAETHLECVRENFP
jgi:hypothetical protein